MTEKKLLASQRLDSHPHSVSLTPQNRKTKLGTERDKDRSSDLHLSAPLGNKQREMALHLSCCHPPPVSHSQTRCVPTDRIDLKCLFLLFLCSAETLQDQSGPLSSQPAEKREEGREEEVYEDWPAQILLNKWEHHPKGNLFHWFAFQKDKLY